MIFTCEAAGNEFPVITSLVNPATGTEVVVDPPYQWQDMRELGAFLTHFERYCVSGWRLGGFDPTSISSQNWLPKVTLDIPDVAVERTTDQGSTEVAVPGSKQRREK